MKVHQLDLSEIHLVTDLFDQYRIFYKQPSDIALAKQFLTARLSNKESIIFLASMTEGHQIVSMGFTQLYPLYSSVQAKRNWLLNDLYVRKSYRLKGVAKQLIQSAVDFAKADGVDFVELSTAVDNIAAQQLYEKTGFKKGLYDSDFFTYRISLTKEQEQID